MSITYKETKEEEAVKLHSLFKFAVFLAPLCLIFSVGFAQQEKDEATTVRQTDSFDSGQLIDDIFFGFVTDSGPFAHQNRKG